MKCCGGNLAFAVVPIFSNFLGPPPKVEGSLLLAAPCMRWLNSPPKFNTTPSPPPTLNHNCS